MKLVTEVAFVSDAQFTVQNNTALTFSTFTYSLNSGKWISKLNDSIIFSDMAQVILTQLSKVDVMPNRLYLCSCLR